MDFEVLDKRSNPLLERTEVRFKFVHTKEATPSRTLARDKVAEATNSKKEAVIIDHMRSDFGRGQTLGYAKVYKNKAAAQANERKYHQKRNHILEGEAKKKGGEKKAAAAAPAPAAEEPAAEEPAAEEEEKKEE